MIYIEYLAVLIFGIVIGNFATTVLYRLPRGITISGFNKEFTKPPFCSKCRHPLKLYEYLPIASWISTTGKCNYCHTPISNSYFLLEILTGSLAVICFYLFSYNIEIYFLMFCFSLTSLLSIFIVTQHHKIPITLTVTLVIEGMIYRTLVEQTILPWISSLCMASIISLWLLRKKEILNVQKHYLIHVIMPASVWCIGENAIWYFILTILFYFINKYLWGKFKFYETSITTLVLTILIQTELM